MDCGVGLSSPSDVLSEMLSLMGLGKEDGASTKTSTPSTFVLEKEDELDQNTNGGSSNNNNALNRQLYNTFCMQVPMGLGQSTGQKHPPCNPTTCRMKSGMCIDCARCLKHCICGDKDTNFIPATCDTPACSNIVCGDCLRCDVHCTCKRRAQAPSVTVSCVPSTPMSLTGEVRDPSTGMISNCESSSPRPPSRLTSIRGGSEKYSGGNVNRNHPTKDFVLRTQSLVSEDSSFNIDSAKGLSAEPLPPAASVNTEFSYNFLLNNSDENFRVNRIMKESSSLDSLSGSSHDSRCIIDNDDIDEEETRKKPKRKTRNRRGHKRSSGTRSSRGGSISSKLSFSSKGSSIVSKLSFSSSKGSNSTQGSF